MKSMSNSEVMISIAGAFVATLLASFSSYMILAAENSAVLLASTGASAMLLFGMPHTPAARPWNLVGGHIISAIIGVASYQFISNAILASSLAIALAMAAMHVCDCMHPPGGATAVTAVIGGVKIHALGYAFVVVPVLFNAIILLSIAMAVATVRERNPFYS